MEAQDRHHDNDHITRAVQEQAEAQLKALFQELPNRIDLVLVTDARSDEPYGRAAREVIQAVSRISDKVALREISLESDQAKEWNVAQAPTMIFCPDKYDIRWSGAPGGRRRADPGRSPAYARPGQKRSERSIKKGSGRNRGRPAGEGLCQPDLPLLPPTGG